MLESKIDGLQKLENGCQLKIGDMCVEMIYSEDNKNLNECILNIIKLKINNTQEERRVLAGRKTKFDIENSNKGKAKIWSVAEYIRLSQEDEGIRRRQAGK